MSGSRTAYESPALALIHDEGFGFHARAAGDELLRRLRRAGLASGRIVDLGCGTGILSRILVDAGYDVLGIDQSAEMLKIARRTVSEAAFRRASFVDAELPPCVAVAAVGEVLGYAFDRRARGGLKALFRRVHGALDPGGLFLFDLAGPGRGLRGVPLRFVEDADWAIVTEIDEDPRARLLRRRMVFFRRDGRRFTRGEEEHTLTLHEPSRVVDDLRSVGFRVRRLRRYGELALLPGLHGFLAAKPR